LVDPAVVLELLVVFLEEEPEDFVVTSVEVGDLRTGEVIFFDAVTETGEETAGESKGEGFTGDVLVVDAISGEETKGGRRELFPT
jgi:hypothetical protein